MRNIKREAQQNIQFYGSDRDMGAVHMSGENARNAGVGDLTVFKQQSISDIRPPTEAPGLVIVNPPYGGRIGDKSKVLPLYQVLGKVLRTNFKGWRVGVVTDDAKLANATKLPFLPVSAPVQHGGIRITLFQTNPLLS